MPKYRKIKGWQISFFFFGVPTSYFLKNDYVHLVARYLGYILCGVDSVTISITGAMLGGGGGQIA